MTKRLSLILMIGSLMCLGLPACGEEEPEVEVEAAGDDPVDEVQEEIAEEQIEEAMEEDMEEADEGGDEMAAGGSVCERAQNCCTAYVDIMTEANPAAANAETACAGVQNATGPTADTVCQTAIDGWRQGLEAMNRDVPESCAAGS